MAAVAGSKGRLETGTINPRPLQKTVVEGLLTRQISATAAAEALVASACIREVGIDTNMICNLSCRYCYLQDRAEALGSVPLDVLHDKLAGMVGAGARLLAFIGKEPLADGRAPELLLRLNDLRKQTGTPFRTGMVTNGTLVERWIDRLVEADLSYIDISVDGLGDRENRLRGDGVAKRIHLGIAAVVKSPLRERFATASVLTEANVGSYTDFVSEMFDRGVATCFSSPVLRFAMSNEVSDLALGMDRIWKLVDELALATGGADRDQQVMIDLPYKYTWSLLRSTRFSWSEIEEDAFEALYWKIAGTKVYIKLNPFSYSYWRAIRITHDGQQIFNMDLAAHSDYAAVSKPLSESTLSASEIDVSNSIKFLADFLERHIGERAGPLHERDLFGQFQRNQLTRAA